MKIKIICTAFMLVLLTAFSGCDKRDTPEEYLKAQIEKVKDGKSELYTTILDNEIDAQKTENFPKEVKDEYLNFLKKIYSNIRYHITKTEDKGKNRYRVTVETEPLDLEETVRTVNEDYTAAIQSTDLTAEITNILMLDQSALKMPVYTDKVSVSVQMDWENGSYKMNEKDFLTLLDLAVADKLAPYRMVAEVFDIREYVEECLDTLCKGSEALEDTVFAEYGFTEQEAEQFIRAEKELLATVSYEVGIPRRVEENHYTVEIDAVPNTSLKSCNEEILNLVNSGDISGMEELKQDYLEALERWTADPQYGEPVKITINVVPGADHLLQINQEEYDSLISMLLPQE